MAVPMLEYETLRLAHSRALRPQDWTQDPALLEICAIAAEMMKTPTSLVSLLSENKQRFVAKAGQKISGPTRDLAFCTHTMMAPAPMLVQDATADERFAADPSVMQAPHIRAYAGVALETAPGIRVGALCAIDFVPREFSDEQIGLLRKLGTVASAMLVSRKKRLELEIELATRSTGVWVHAAPPAYDLFPQPQPSWADLINAHRDYVRALDAEEFVPYYQPKFELQKRTLAGFEALARWNSKRGVLPPAAFLTLLEDRELASRLTQSMLVQMARDLRSWRDQGLECGSLAINASAGDFLNDHFATDFLKVVSDHGLQPRDFILEVTERIIMEDHDMRLRNSLKNLQQSGVMIALDDFGTGHAGLQHLRNWPVNQIKIDRMFVRDCLLDSRDSAIVESIIQMADAIGLGVTAEGVETDEQLQLLRNLQCEMGQGDLFSKPMSSADVPEFVRKYRRWS
jgi:EAL domain-containing protein (putative c-di-GMP-specific phosphodiesterase class I)